MAFRSDNLKYVVLGGTTVESNGFFLHIDSILGTAIELQFSDKRTLNPETGFGQRGNLIKYIQHALPSHPSLSTAFKPETDHVNSAQPRCFVFLQKQSFFLDYSTQQHHFLLQNMTPTLRSYMSLEPDNKSGERQSNCDHSARQRWIRVWEPRACRSCWRERLVILGVILAIVGAILLSVSLFDPFDVRGDRRAMGIAGIVLTGLAIAFAAVTG